MRGTWTPPVQCGEREGNFQTWPIQRKDLETMLRCSQTSDGTLPSLLLPQGQAWIYHFCLLVCECSLWVTQINTFLVQVCVNGNSLLGQTCEQKSRL